jgi:hypothetical protein
MPFAVKLMTEKNPFGSVCHPVFETRDECQRYIAQLRRSLGEAFVEAEPVIRPDSMVNATFPAKHRRFLWIMPGVSA